MKMMYMRSCLWLLVLSLMVPLGGFAQDSGPAPPVFRQEELDQMLAPIALYPDSLLIQVLMASTYPLEVVQAARWVNQNPNLKGDNLAVALDQKYWDPSVKSLVNFPPVLAMMNDKLEWTQNIGDAFLGQKDQVMATVQNLRAKAQAQGTLETTSEQVVVVRENTIVIEPANPRIVYVPAYDPFVVYGPWWYPAYPPYYYYPPGYAVASASYVSFGVGMAVGVAWGYAWGSVNWANHHVYVNPAQNITINNNYYNHAIQNNMNISGHGSSAWQHDPSHRKGVAYRDPGLRQQFGQGGNPGADSRKDFRGFDQGGHGQLQKAGDVPGQNQRRDAGIHDNRQPGERRNEPAGGEAVKRDRQSLDQRKDFIGKDNAEGSRRTLDRSKDAVHRDSSSTLQNRTSSPIESLNRGGNEVKRQSERGRTSRESIPVQKPSQTFQGGGGSPNIGGSKRNTGGGGVAIPNIGGGDRGAGGGGVATPNIGGGDRGAGGGGATPSIGGGDRGARGGGVATPSIGGGDRGARGGGATPNIGGDGGHGGGRRQQ